MKCFVSTDRTSINKLHEIRRNRHNVRVSSINFYVNFEKEYSIRNAIEVLDGCKEQRAGLPNLRYLEESRLGI